jgi:MFS family permease
MIPVALPELQRAFEMSASASTWLLTVFALASAIGHPLAGFLADRFGSRRVLVTGLVVTGVGGLAGACAATFPLLVALRAVQAIGTSAAFPAGIALLQMLDAREGSGRPLSAAWLGAVAMSRNLGAALGPVLGGAFVAIVGWQAIFLVNLPSATAAAILVLRHFPADHADPQRNGGAPVRDRVAPLRGPLLSVYARFAAACTVFFAGFFAPPLWLIRSFGLGAAETGAIMLPMVIASALTMPIAVRTVSLSGVGPTLILSASGFVLERVSWPRLMLRLRLSRLLQQW